MEKTKEGAEKKQAQLFTEAKLNEDGQTLHAPRSAEPVEVTENEEKAPGVLSYTFNCKNCGTQVSTDRPLIFCATCGATFADNPKRSAFDQYPPNLAAAVIQVMNEVKGIEKNSTVGEGKYAFSAVSDKDVKKQVGEAMARAGLCLLPVKVMPTHKTERWTEKTDRGERVRQQTFSEVQTVYKLLHVSGESELIEGYGHGIDAQDKSAGKATTYALKYALLYTFLIPTGKIEDADNTQPKAPPAKAKQGLNDQQLSRAIDAINKGTYTKDKLKEEYFLTSQQLEEVEKINA